MEILERFFLKRYIKYPKRNLFRFSSIAMVLGIILSVGILSAGLHLFQGYESTLKKLLLESFAHVGISSSDGSLMSNEEIENACKTLTEHNEVLSCVPVLQFALMAQNKDKVRAASLKCYKTEETAPYHPYIVSGRPKIASGEVIVGHYLLAELGLALGDTINLNYPRLDNITPLGIPSTQYDYIIAGVFRSGYYENDRNLVISTVEDARTLMMIPEGFSRIEILLKDADEAPVLARSFIEELGYEYMAMPWNIYAESLLRLVTIEKWLIFIVFSFLVLIAGINVISTVSTTIIDRQSEIAVLKTLGAASHTIRRLFAIRVGLVAIISVLIGQIFGILLSWLVEKQTFYRLKGDVYFIDTLGANITIPNILIVFLVASLLIFICIMIPLKQIERLQVIEIIRKKYA
ncbi:MAG: ABC transporter permease [Candidatus Cloacimonetes bacterium]|nr:ABC transporter permease [Candidatus Cloacimonadota bacterium]